MAGIYIHIPFCKQACYYCDFHFSTSLKHKDALIEGILKEIDLRKEKWKQHKFETIYFGGGTPSIVNVEDIKKILNKLYNSFNIQATEITLEGNPDDLTLDKMEAYKDLNINRLSIGIQSFADEDLKKLNRSHNASQAIDVLKNAKKAGFDNITLDLIYGIPGLTDDQWKENIHKALSFDIPHISAYALTVEKNTALDSMIRKKTFPEVKDEQSARQFKILRSELIKKGFEHYEVSNFAKPDYHSKHNSLYWQNIPYLGLGPSAHSFQNNIRRWNIANNMLYLKKMDTGKYFEYEKLSPTDLFNEALLTGLRTQKGVKVGRFSPELREYLLNSADKYIKQGMLELKDDYLKPTADSLFLIEGIIVDLFLEEA